MSSEKKSLVLEQQEAADLSIRAGSAFRPRSPIDTTEFFAGRWEQMTAVADAVTQPGLHVIIFGERGVGKTSLANVIDPLLIVMDDSIGDDEKFERIVAKVNVHNGDTFGDVWCRIFDKISWVSNKPRIGYVPDSDSELINIRDAMSVSSNPTIDEVQRVLSALNRSVFIFDEFDRAAANIGVTFTDLIKSLSDNAINSTIVVVGVSETVDELVRDHASIVRSMIQVRLPRMNERELADVLEKGGKAIDMEFAKDATGLIVRMSQGLPHYTHLIGLHSVREATKRRSRLVELRDVYNAFGKAVEQAIQSITDRYLQAIHSAHKDALYNKVLLACASASSISTDALGYFHPSDVVAPLSKILSRSNVTIATFQKHINEFCEEARGPVLERSGVSRAYKYRFRDPLLPPYIFMTSVSDGLISSGQLTELTAPASIM